MAAAAPAFDSAADRLMICLGPGGVGKTTVGAALALQAALSGRAVDVMTVDPAPRLLDALGLDGQRATPQEVMLDGLSRRGGGGRLRAMRLDPKRMFDRLVENYAPSAAARDAILTDRIYRNISNALAGVADYMAAEQLLELRRAGSADLIVLDTPPAREALDFLDAPRRMLELLSSRALVLLGASHDMMRGPLGLLDLAARAVLAAFDRVTGLHLLADVHAFVRRFDGMYTGFAERAREAQALLRDGGSRLVLITTPEPQRVEQALEFIAALEPCGLRVGALVVNRVMAPLPARDQIRHAAVSPALKRKLLRNFADFSALKTREAAWLDRLREVLPHDIPLLQLPELGRQPQTLKDLVQLANSIRPCS